MLDELMTLAKVPETAQQCAKIFMELADKWQTQEKEAKQKEALETALMTGRKKAERTIDNAVIAEAVERSVNRHVYSMLQGEIFSDEYRNAVVTEILRGNSSALYLKGDVEESVRQWFRDLENALNEHYSAERLDVLRHEIQSRMRMDAIGRDLAEVLSLLRPKQDFTTSNQDYKDIFEAPLFLHSGNSEVCLQNLFVPHRFTVKSGFDSNESMDEYLARFVRDEKARFLFIEGDAGCGKSSLTAYLSWHYEQRDRTARDIFGDAQLMTVRLRNIDVPENGRPEQRLKRGVLEFLYGQQERNATLEKRFRESGGRILFLDGYDELCTIVNIENADNLLKRLNELDCKIIVTTRPNYIRFQHFEKNYWHITLEHFDGAQRREWLERYERCGQTLGEVNQQYLERIGDGETAGICDTPMGLYMVAAGHFTPDMLENEWAIYHQIFHNELSETNYNPNSSEAHSIWEYQDLLYRVSEEIAWYLYQRNNENLLVPDSEITRIIGELDISEDKRKVVERCFALCGYWKANTNRGCVEFYHNNIRDFFLCEKLMRELNNAYREYGDALRDEHVDITPFLRRLCGLFQYGRLNKTVLFFIKQRAAYADKEEPDLCVDTEREERHTARIFETMLLRGDFYTVCAERWKLENPVKTIARILGNTVNVYRHLYEPFLKPKEYIQWWTDVEAVNKDGTFRQLLREVLKRTGFSDLRGMNLQKVDLSFADLHGTDLSGANLERANLHNANLQASLISANLNGADLTGANLWDAALDRAVLANTQLFGANLGNASLSEVDFQDADLRGAIGYHLQGTKGTPITD